MYIPPLPFRCNALVFDDLTYLIFNAHFCHAILFVASTLLIAVALFCQPVYDHRHRVDFWCQTICLPQYPTFVFVCSHLYHIPVVVVETSLATEQKALPLILPTADITFSKQL